jgi:hypothetical protein
MTLLHFALRAEAQCFLEYFRFNAPLPHTPSAFKLYGNEKLTILISGTGARKTEAALRWVRTHRVFQAAYNIGIVGCNDTSVPIGTLFSYLPYTPQRAEPPVISVSAPQTKSTRNETALYDMELEAFYHALHPSVDSRNLGAFKVVSDHLDATVPSKSYVKALFLPYRDTIVKAVTDA